MGERAIHVKAEDVSLKLTLSAKLQKKPFADAVLTPFTKAFNKKKGTEWTTDDLVSVTVDGDLITDYSLAASVVLLGTQTVHAELMYRVARAEMTIDANPFGSKQWELPASASAQGTVDFVADEDDRAVPNQGRRRGKLAQVVGRGPVVVVVGLLLVEAVEVQLERLISDWVERPLDDPAALGLLAA